RWGWDTDGWQSWTWLAGTSRWRMRMRRSGSSSMGRSIIMPRSVQNSKRAGIATGHGATRRRFSISMRRRDRSVLSDSREGLRLRERASQMDGRLAATVRSHLIGHLPLDLFLAGGLHSRGLAAVMAPMVKETIRTFSVGYAEPEANEPAYARLAARAIGAEQR